MKLSEAISLGHTLIREDRDVFYDPNDGKPCGCAIGSAYVAAGGRSALVDGVRWLERHWPWTSDAASGRLLSASRYEWAFSVAVAISVAHGHHSVPRLEIAQMVAEIEPQGPEGDYVPDGRESRQTAAAIVEEAVSECLREG